MPVGFFPEQQVHPRWPSLGNRFRLTFTTNTLICWFAATCSSIISSEERVAPSQ